MRPPATRAETIGITARSQDVCFVKPPRLVFNTESQSGVFHGRQSVVASDYRHSHGHPTHTDRAAAMYVSRRTAFHSFGSRYQSQELPSLPLPVSFAVDSHGDPPDQARSARRRDGRSAPTVARSPDRSLLLAPVPRLSCPFIRIILATENPR